MNRFLLPAILMLVCFSGAEAHELRPGIVDIRETEPGLYDVVWRVPARGTNERLSLHLEFADDVTVVDEPVSAFIGGAHMQRLRVSREGGLTGTPITILGLSSTFTDVLLRIERIDGTEITRRLTPDRPTYIVEASPSIWQVAWTYFVLGVEHILFGVDHLLFVFALMLIVSDWRKLIGTITAFTLAHSITLGLATLGIVEILGPPVEAIIALSIVFVASEVIRGKQGKPGMTARWPWVVSFSFGLLHGFGFAGALSEVGLPQKSIPMALLTFNIGVEIGQLLFVAALVTAYTLIMKFRKRQDEKDESVGLPAWLYVIPAYLIGGVAAYWTIERTVGFWSG